MSKPIQCVAAKAIIRHEGKILVLRQSAETSVTGAGRCHPPGGMVEPGETLRETLVREVQEETGLEVTVGPLLSVEEWRANIRGDDCWFVGVFFECAIEGDSTIQLQEAEAQGFVWVDSSNLGQADILEPALSVIGLALAEK